MGTIFDAATIAAWRGQKTAPVKLCERCKRMQCACVAVVAAPRQETAEPCMMARFGEAVQTAGS